jgi:hypothetical protein
MRRFNPILLTAILVIFCAAISFGQQGSTGEIRGRVTNEEGAIIVDAKVAVKNLETGISRQLMTDARGRYRALLLNVGSYEITVEKQDYKKFVQSGVKVQVGDVLTLNAVLEIGEFSSVITITGDAPIIEVSQSSVSSVVSEELIENLPINGRDYRDFVLVTPTAGTSSRNGVTFGGSRGMYTNMTIDGADNNSPFFSEQNGGEIDPTFTVSQESVKEFRVLNNGFSAEFGRSMGSLINVVTKSGTNDFRGSGFFFFQNDAMIADQVVATNFGEDTDYFEQDEFSRKQFGGSIGGPLAEDKAFFFVSADVQRYETPREVRFSWSDADRAANPELAALEGNYNSTDDNLVVFGKVDYQFNDEHSFSVRFNYSDADQENGLGYYPDNAVGMQGQENESTTSTVGTLTSFLSDNMINELRVQYATNEIERVNNGTGPETRISGVGRIGSTWYLPIVIDVNRFQVSDNFNWMLQDHDVKFGVDWNHTSTEETFIGFSRGQVNFNSLEDYLAGDVNYALQKVPLNGLTMNESGNFEFTGDTFAVYAQDKWQPDEQLTLDFGLRWEGTFNPEPPNPNPAFPLTNQLYDDKDNFQPRFGIAYDLFGDGTTVVRGAAGVFYGVTPSIVFANVWFNNGYTGVVQYVPGYRVPWPYDAQSVINSVAGAGTGLDIDYADPDYQEARTYRFNVGVERELMQNTSISFDFMYAKGDYGMRRVDTNMAAPIPGAAPNGRDLYSRSNRPNPLFGETNAVVSTGEMEYFGATVLLKSRIEDFTIQSSFTLARDKDDDSNERSSGGITYTEPYNPEADYGLSDRDRSYRFVGSVVYHAPYDVDVSGIFTFMSGRPYSANWGRDINGDGESNDRAEPGSNGTVWVERNTYRIDEWANFDLRVSKTFRIDKYEITGLFEGFNLFNWESPSSVYSTSRYSSFGLTSSYQNSRRLQLGARIRF